MVNFGLQIVVFFFFANFGHQFVVFPVVLGIFEEFRTVVMVFCGFFPNFRTVLSTFGLLGLWRCHFGRYVVTNQCSLCSNLHFACFVPHFLCFSDAVRTWSIFVQRWTGHGKHYPNDVCGIV